MTVRWAMLAVLIAMSVGCSQPRTATLPVSAPQVAQRPVPPHHSPYSRDAALQRQRMMAEQFDPYPDNEIAPEIVGGRPLDFQKPRPEARRAQWWNPKHWFGW